MNGFAHTFQSPIKNMKINFNDIDKTEKHIMLEDQEFEHISSSGENSRVSLFEVLKRTKVLENRNNPKFVHTSLQSRLNFTQRNVNNEI